MWALHTLAHIRPPVDSGGGGGGGGGDNSGTLFNPIVYIDYESADPYIRPDYENTITIEDLYRSDDAAKLGTWSGDYTGTEPLTLIEPLVWDADITFAFWMHPTFVHYTNIFATPNHYTYGSLETAFALGYDTTNHKLGYMVYTGQTAIHHHFGNAFPNPLNTWGHVVVTMKRQSGQYTIISYWNGEVLDSDITFTSPPVQQGQGITLGNSNHNPQVHFDKYIDEFHIYDKILTPAEVTALYTKN